MFQLPFLPNFLRNGLQKQANDKPTISLYELTGGHDDKSWSLVGKLNTKFTAYTTHSRDPNADY